MVLCFGIDSSSVGWFGVNLNFVDSLEFGLL